MSSLINFFNALIKYIITETCITITFVLHYKYAN